MKTKPLWRLMPLALALTLSLSLQSCGDDDDPQPTEQTDQPSDEQGDEQNDDEQKEDEQQGGEQQGGGTTRPGAYIDLGLPSGLKWATCNLGATVPEETGSLYTWGAICATDGDVSVNAPTWDMQTSDLRAENIIDEHDCLQPAYDAAAIHWGGKWRMPTLTEAKELLRECTLSWTKRNDVPGYTVTSKTNGNSIFMPTPDRYNSNYSGLYWTSTIGANGSYGPESYTLSLIYYTMGNLGASNSCSRAARYRGRMIRPVWK